MTTERTCPKDGELCDPRCRQNETGVCAREKVESAACLVALGMKAKNARKNQSRRERDQAMRDMGLTKVRGALGGVYWE